MALPQNDFVRLKVKGVTRISTPERAIAAILLSDNNERTIAVPLEDIEEGLFHRTKQVSDKKPQPYRLLLTCLSELGAELDSIQIIYTPTLDFSSRLIIRMKEGSDITVPAFCSEAIACAEAAKVPIYAEEELVTAISVPKTKSGY